MHEELGAAIEPMRRLWESVTPWRTHLAWWLADFSADAPLVPNPAEVESLHWLAPQQMLELPELLESNRHFLAASRRGCSSCLGLRRVVTEPKRRRLAGPRYLPKNRRLKISASKGSFGVKPVGVAPRLIFGAG